MSTLHRLAAEMRTDPVLRREAYEMSLYVSIVLLSALNVFDADNPPADGQVLALAMGTTVGLVLAHSFAVWVSTRLIGQALLDVDQRDVLIVELAGALVVALVALLSVLVAPTSVELVAARLAVAGIIAVVVYLESRSRVSRTRAVLYGLVALVLGVIVASVKALLGH